MADANLENVAARIRARKYGSRTDRLAQDVAQGLAGQTKLASYRRGLAGGVIAGQDGGTTLGVGDNFAAYASRSLQPPQKGLPSPNGALGVRMQGRVELERRTLPGVVVSSAVDDVALTVTLTVVIPYATTPRLDVDATTGENAVAAQAFDGLLDVSSDAANGEVATSLTDDSIEVTVPLPADGVNTYEDGQIIDVTTARQWDVRTIWANKEGRRVPVVSRALVGESHSTPALPGVTPADNPASSCSRVGINVLAGTSGTPLSEGGISLAFRWNGTGYTPDTYDTSPTAAATGLATSGSYWRIIEYSGEDFDGVSGIYDTVTELYTHAQKDYPWFGAGRVAADGSLIGFPSTYTASGVIPGVIPPLLWPSGDDFSIGFYCQSGCADDDGNIFWHGYLPGHPDGINQKQVGYKLVTDAADWP